MSAVARLSTSWLLLGEYGATMTEAQFRARFAPAISDKTYRNKVSAGIYPRPTDGVLDTQEVAQWWQAIMGGVANPEPAATLPSFGADWLAVAKASRIPCRQPVIYFLFDGDELVYVGQSHNWHPRMNSHLSRGGKKFDSVAALACPSETIDAIERELIAALHPKYNIAGKPR